VHNYKPSAIYIKSPKLFFPKSAPLNSVSVSTIGGTAVRFGTTYTNLTISNYLYAFCRLEFIPCAIKLGYVYSHSLVAHLTMGMNCIAARHTHVDYSEHLHQQVTGACFTPDTRSCCTQTLTLCTT